MANFMLISSNNFKIFMIGSRNVILDKVLFCQYKNARADMCGQHNTQKKNYENVKLDIGHNFLMLILLTTFKKKKNFVTNEARTADGKNEYFLTS